MPVMGGIMLLLFGSIAAIGLKTLVESRWIWGCPATSPSWR
jgi:xanthine/uracil permease